MILLMIFLPKHNESRMISDLAGNDIANDIPAKK